MEEVRPATEKEFMEALITLCDDLAWGKSADPSRLYALTSPDAGPEHMVRLAEAFGLMLAKLEGREYENARLVEQLRARNKELELGQASLSERNEVLLRMVQDATSLKNVVARCKGMRQVVELALTIARRPINTLIQGPTGVGKEVMAKLIHSQSPRRAGPFVAVNCTAIPDTLFESEMFGIEKGVATGVSARKGLVEEAHGGTLFLDELADMSLPSQAKLLRVLEAREVQRVGSARPVPVDINLVAATHVPLLQAVHDGRFREDLYYRINVVELHIPPLRERGDDILLLAQLFLDRHSQRQSRGRMSLASCAHAALLAYDWPGNVRELNNEMERCAALCPEHMVRVEHLSPRLGQGQGGGTNSAFSAVSPAHCVPSAAPAAAVVPAAPDCAEFPPLGSLRLEDVERVCVLKALERTRGNKKRAADVLGLTREGLRKKLLRMQIDKA